MIEAPHYSPAGARKSAGFALPEDMFDGTVNRPVLHEAVKVYLANQRQGTASTKTRGFVSGGNQKPWKQKGTGRARQGSTRAPNWPGGGKVFGPLPRDYRMGIPRKVKQLARKSALNARASEGSLLVVERFEQQSPKTRELLDLLGKLGVAERKVLLLTHGVSEAVYLSSRNLQRVHAMPFADAGAYDVLWADVIVVEEPALAGEPAVPFVRAFVPQTRVDGAPVRTRPARPAAPAKPAAKVAKAEKQAAKAEKKATRAGKKATKPAAAKKAAKPRAAKPAARKAAKPRAKAAPKKKKGGK